MLHVHSAANISMIDTATIDVVLADDEEVNRTVAQMGLEMQGFDGDKIRQVDTGTAAVEEVMRLQSEEGRCILVILDLHMPDGLSGDEAAEAIKKCFSSLTRKPFLTCCSSEVLEDLKEKPWAVYFDHFAPKPMVSVAVEDTVKAFSDFVEATEK